MNIREIADKLANEVSARADYSAEQGKMLESLRKAKEFSGKLENEMLSNTIDKGERHLKRL